MSGPIDVDDLAGPVGQGGRVPTSRAEVRPSRVAKVGSVTVRRALPSRGRRTVGPWCFADHFGPVGTASGEGLDVGPHPHIGLQTVTWLFSGALVHRDSLGSEQPIRPGQLNLMTAGRGVAHAEETDRSRRGDLHGVQLWLAQPEATRDGAPEFEHHEELPRVELAHGHARVLVGSLGAAESPALRDTDHVGAELELRAGVSTLPLAPGSEHVLIGVDGVGTVDGHEVGPGTSLVLSPGRDELAVRCARAVRVMLLGGAPFTDPLFMWWNFVARGRDEIDRAREDWATRAARFGTVTSRLARIEAPSPPWRSPAR